MQRALAILVRLQITQFGSFGKCGNGLRFPPVLLKGSGFGGVSGGCSGSLPDDFEFLSTKPAWNSFGHSTMSRNRSSDAVCRTGSPEAELLLVSADLSADTEITSSLVTPGRHSLKHFVITPHNSCGVLRNRDGFLLFRREVRLA